MELLKYPIGRFEAKTHYTVEEMNDNIAILQVFPQELRNATESLTDEQLDTAYRPGGWTIRQVVHHCADSHMNSIIRFKLALTEDMPTIKPYHEDLWAHLADAALSIESSLAIIDGVHLRLTILLKSLTKEQLTRCFRHPDMDQPIDLATNTALYAWHSRHHLAHIISLKEKMGW